MEGLGDIFDGMDEYPYPGKGFEIVSRERSRGSHIIYISAPGKTKKDVYEFAFQNIGRGLVTERHGSTWEYEMKAPEKHYP